MPQPPTPNLRSYDTIVVAFSGGKDSIASLIALIEAGVPPERIELYHHDVDGGADAFMDWPSTTAYCHAVASAFGVPLYCPGRRVASSGRCCGPMHPRRRSCSRPRPARWAVSAGATLATPGSGFHRSRPT